MAEPENRLKNIRNKRLIRSLALILTALVLYIITAMVPMLYIIMKIYFSGEPINTGVCNVQLSFISLGLMGLAFILSFVPLSLIFSLYSGNYRERIRGDIWTDLKKMKLDKFVRESAGSEDKLIAADHNETGHQHTI